MKLGNKGIKRRLYVLDEMLVNQEEGKKELRQTVDEIKEYFDEESVDRALSYFVDGVIGSFPKKKFKSYDEQNAFLSEYYDLMLTDTYFLDMLAYKTTKKLEKEPKEKGKEKGKRKKGDDDK
jgi:hypothetical protein